MTTTPKTVGVAAVVSVLATAGSVAVSNYLPDWKSYQQTGNPSDIISSPQVAAVFGTKVDAMNGQAQGLQIQGGTQTVTPGAGDNSNNLANTRYVDAAAGAVAPAIKANPTLIGIQQGNVTFNVCTSGCAFSTIHDAFYAALNLAHWALDSTTTITVQVADGTYNETWQFVSQDPAGYRVKVIGDTADKTKVVVNFTNVSGNNLGAFVANYGGQIGYIDGMTINAVGAISSQTATAIHWTANSHGAGIAALNNGVVQVGPHVAISGFYYGLVADHGGSMTADGVSVSYAGDVGIFAKFGGIMRCHGCSSIYTGDSDNALGSNYMAEQGAHLDIDSAKGDQALYAGIAAISGGSVWANHYQGGSSGTGGLGGRGAWGIWAVNGGNAQVELATLQNYYDGAHTQAGGSIDLNGTTLQNNNNNGVTADGGVIRGVAAVIKNNGGFGVQGTHMGTIEFYQTFANMSGNTAGNVSQDASGTTNGASYAASSIVLQ